MYVVYFLSCLVPRSRELFVYVGWHRTKDGEVFADNTKYLFLYANSTDQKRRHVWIAKSKAVAQILQREGLPSYYQWSLRGIWCQLRAGYLVLDAFLQPENFMFCGRAMIIQLLHGKGMKKKGYNEVPLRPQHYIFATSPFSLDILPENFKHGARCFSTGYARNDVLFAPIDKGGIGVDTGAKDILAKARRSGKCIVLYAPTFRRGMKTYDTILDMNALATWATTHNVLFVSNLHNKYRNQKELLESDHIMLLPEGDIYPLFMYFDILITDYSSIFVDYLLLDRPIIFYPYDLEAYNRNEGLVADYDAITPGPKVFTFSELLTSMQDAMTEQVTWSAERARVRKLYHTHTDGNAAARIWEILKKEL